VVLITGESREGVMRKVEVAHVDSVMFKPFGSAEIQRGIKKRSADRATFCQCKTTRVDTFSPVVLHQVEAPGDRVLWRQLVYGYHHLGYRVPFGASVSYLIYYSDKRILII